jgi:GNAT superfamily N-acetyltransferase
MTRQFSVRLATPDDAEVIGYHRARMFQDMGQIPTHLYDAFKRRSQERLRELLIAGEYVGWLASLVSTPEKIVAGAGVQLRNVLPHPANDQRFAEGRHALVINVFTELEWRRQGLGERLLKEIIEWSQAQKIDRLVLHASEQGRRLYERLGFVLTNEMKFLGNVERRSAPDRHEH